MFFCTTNFISLIVRTHYKYVTILPVQKFHRVIGPDTFHVQYHFSIIPCDQVSLVVYTSF